MKTGNSAAHNVRKLQLSFEAEAVGYGKVPLRIMLRTQGVWTRLAFAG